MCDPDNCPRCDGYVVQGQFSCDCEWLHGWRCVNCGWVLIPVQPTNMIDRKMNKIILG